jgi:hypothetical protein
MISSCLRIAVGSRLLDPPHLLGQCRSDLQIAAALAHLRRVLAVSFAEETDQSAESLQRERRLPPPRPGIDDHAV